MRRTLRFIIYIGVDNYMYIKEVEKELKMSSHTLRYYEKIGLVKPSRDMNGYRNYSQDDIQLLKKIRFLRDLEIPIEDIIEMNNQEIDFQDILDQHIQKLDLKIQSLQYVQSICKDLKDKDIPLLDAMTDERIIKEEKINQSEFKKGLKKAIDYLRPIKTIVIGSRCDAGTFISGMFMMFFIAIIIGLGFGIGIPHMIYSMNLTLSQTNTMSTIPCYPANTTSVIICTIISYCIFILCLIMMNTKQNYIELTDSFIYICNPQLQNRYSMLLGMLFKQTHKRNKRYRWDELKEVHIQIVFSTMTVRYGISHIYLPEFTFIFHDGYEYKIKSGISFNEDTKTAYKIINNKNIPIVTTDEIIKYFHQNNKTGYEFFEELYHLNSK